MKKEWFEPGPDGESPFEREYYNHRESGTIAGNAIAAAFRALLAGEEQQNILDAELFEQQAINDSPPAHKPPALQVGDVVRLERYENWREGVPWINCSDHPRIGKECAITGIAEAGRLLVDDTIWPRSAVTLIRRGGEAAPVDADAKDAEIAELRAEVERLQGELQQCNRMNRDLTAEVERWKSIADAHEQNYKAMLRRVDEVVAERDALRARKWDNLANVLRVLGPEMDRRGFSYECFIENLTHTDLLEAFYNAHAQGDEG